MKVKRFDRKTVKFVRDAVTEELEKLGNKLGVKIEGGNGRFSDNTLTLKLEISTVGKGGVVNSKEREDFLFHAGTFNYRDVGKDWLDENFRANGKTFKLIGMSPRSHKYPFLAKNLANGKVYKMTKKMVVDGFGG